MESVGLIDEQGYRKVADGAVDEADLRSEGDDDHARDCQTLGTRF